MLSAKSSLLLLLTALGLGSIGFMPKSRVGQPITIHLKSADADDVTGHFTQTDRVQMVQLVAPVINVDETGCVLHDDPAEISNCISTLKFSDPDVPVIAVNGCIGGTPVNLGDLDNDGLDEIGLLPQWFSSCWHDYHVYTYKQGAWVPAVPPFATHCNQWEANIQPIIKDPAQRGHVIITYSALEGTDIVFKTKSLAIR